MLTWDDFLAYCDLNEDEVDLVADYAGLPKMVAAQMAFYMMREPSGITILRAMIEDELAAARARDERPEIRRLKALRQRLDRRAFPNPAAREAAGRLRAGAATR